MAASRTHGITGQVNLINQAWKQGRRVNNAATCSSQLKETQDMKNTASKLFNTLIISASIAIIGGCDSGGGGGDTGAAATQQPAIQAATPVANDFKFPAVANVNGNYSVTIPGGPAPTFSARRTIEKGNGSIIEFGDTVVLNYSMFSWSTGELIESSDTLDEPIAVRAGITEGIPQYMTKSLLGRSLGDKLQIIFERGMEDLPVYLDPNDAYVVVVELI